MGQQVEVLMLEFWWSGPVFQRRLTTIIMRGTLARWRGGRPKHWVELGDWETEEMEA